MKLTSSWRLPLAVAILAMFVAFVAWPGARPERAEANVTSVTIAPAYGEDGDTIDVDIVGTLGAPATLTVSPSGTSTVDNTADDCTDAEGLNGCGAASGGPAAAVTWDDVDGAYTATVTLTLDCSEPEIVTVDADDGGTTDSDTILCIPELNDPQVTVEKDANDNASYTFDWDTNGDNCALFVEGSFVEFDDDGHFDLEDNDQADFYCENSVSLTVDERDDDDFVGIGDCEEGDDGIDDISGSSVLFDVSELDTGDTVFCTWVNDDSFVPTPTVVVGKPTSVSMVLSSGVVDCGGSILVQVLPKNSTGGPAAAGTIITMSSSQGGSFDPASSLTSAFDISLANFLYTAPANLNGPTVLTATAGTAVTTKTIQVVCGTAVVTATSVPLSPPSAGSGGLLDSTGAGYLPAIVALLLTGGSLGLTAVALRSARRRG
jgi:hypothetical protein